MPRPACRRAARLAVLASLGLTFLAAPPAARGAGFEMFSTEAYSTAEKPQSKLWFHDGAWWAILQGPDGVAFYELAGSNWEPGAFADAVLTGSGQADVKWTGSRLLVLVYAPNCLLFEYTYESATRAWLLASGFPVTVPNPSGSETMVLEQDSTGRLWTAARGGTDILVYYSTSADHRTWASTPVTLRTGVNVDDICSIVAFGGNRLGVFWSDQNRDEFGFRVHNDTDAVTTWGTVEIADSGSGHADDHINLAYDSSGRVYAITKDDIDEMRVHRRDTGGSWTTKTDVIDGTGTRGIIMVSEADAKVYVLFTRWDITPETIEYRVASISTLEFGGTTTFISTSANLNNVTGTKQLLPAGDLVAVAEDGSSCWFNRLGTQPPAAPDPPRDVTATVLGSPLRVQVAWSEPASGPPDGYDVYRQVDGGSYSKLNSSLLTSTSYTDASPPLAALCYQVRAVEGDLTSDPSTSGCADNSPLPPPGPPLDVVASVEEIPAALSLSFDEGSGQTAADASGNANHARLGSASGGDNNDPLWVTSPTGFALQFDGTNDYAEVTDAASLDVPESFTVEAWVRHTSGTGTVLSKGNSGSRTYRLMVTSAGDAEFFWETQSGSDREVIAADAITDTDWHHLAGVYDQAAGENRLYVDGELAATASASGAAATNSQPLYLGTRYSSGLRDYWKGSLDEVRVIPAVLYTQDFQPAARREAPVAPALRLPLALAAAGSAPPPTVAAQRIHLQWQAPETGAEAIGYFVYRSTDGGGFLSLQPTALAGLTYDDVSPPVGWTCYRVSAVNLQGLEGEPSDSACVRVLPPPPGPPQAVAAALVEEPPVLPTGIAAYFFEEMRNQLFADSTGNGHQGQLGTLAGIDPQDPRWAVGIFGGCLRFDGIDDRARVADATDLRFTSSFTIEAWICPEGQGERCVLSKGVETGINYALSLDDSSRAVLRWNDTAGAAHGVRSEAAIPSGTWHHVAGVYDMEGRQSRLFVDGVLAAAAADSGLPATSAHALRLGAQQTTTIYVSPFAGSLDLVRLSAGALYTSGFVPPRTYVPQAGRWVEVSWQPPAGGAPAAYAVYRQQDGGAFARLFEGALPLLAYSDLDPPSGTLCYQLAAIDSLGQEGAPSETGCAALPTTDAPAEDAPANAASVAFALHASPNPARDVARILLRLPAAAPVRVDVFNLRGQRVATLGSAMRAAGGQVLRWDGRTASGEHAASGVYWLVATCGAQQRRTKLVLIR